MAKDNTRNGHFYSRGLHQRNTRHEHQDKNNRRSQSLECHLCVQRWLENYGIKWIILESEFIKTQGKLRLFTALSQGSECHSITLKT